ncbi:MAG TPA: methyltransferase domain-containing protein [Syntrophorhabdaceae bacterium]|nr:methyltransferase domain-containing protein [Syntrophorhabdaceae bacterium]HPU30908.1 methyltransferase domain-containing protein [Syntrophorhabdaceae bacterium]
MIKKVIISLLVITGIIICVNCDRKPVKKTQPDTPFASTPHKIVKEMLKLADTGKDDIVYDLGSGDGRIVISAARDFGAKGVGIELDGELIKESIENAKKEGVEKKVRFIQEDFFEVDIKDATVVTLYLLPEINELLKDKLLKELRPGARVVSHMWGIGDWEPDKILNAYDKTLYMWFVPDCANGDWLVVAKGRYASKNYNLKIKQRYQKIKAVLSDDKKTYEFSHANLYGNEINLYGSYAYKGKVTILSFEGFIRGDVIEGKAYIKEPDSLYPEEFMWKARRVRF